MKSRREFLLSCRTLAVAGGAAGLTRLGRMTALAQSPAYRGLVCIFLFGGNDNNNTIAPITGADYTDYQNARKGLAIPQAQLRSISATGGRTFGLHPRLTGIQALYNQGKAAGLLNVGMLVRPTTKADLRTGGAVPRNLYSHSDQTAQWQAANPNGPAGSGWSGRAADLLQFSNPGSIPPAISVNGNSLQLTGNSTRPLSISPGAKLGLDGLGDATADRLRDTTMPQLLTFDTGVSLIATASGILGASLRNAVAVNTALETAPALTTVFPNTGLGRQLAQVAKIISARVGLGMNRQIFFCGLGGFDNHSDLLPSHDNLMGQLDAALSAFYQATVEMSVANEVTTFTESEFGRTLDGNSTVGSDHAWGGNHLIVGGSVRGSEVYGTLPALRLGGPDDAGSRGLFIPTTSLDQYGATLASWFGVGSGDLNTVFPNLANFTTKTLGFLPVA
jgi:uncharacterized protein (DUF1501 family)